MGAARNLGLIVTTAQYRLPDRPNILRIDLPLHRIQDDVLRQAAREWGPRLEHLPRPRIAVLVGGQSGQYVLDRARAADLGRRARDLAKSLGGSLMITTSARTPAHAAAAITAELDVPHVLHEWQRGPAENPYLAYLALADQFIVTGESMSMLTEACATRKPVHIYDLRDPVGGSASPAERLRQARRALGYRSATHRLAQRFAPVRMRRDITALQEALIAQGRAVWLGDALPETAVPPLPDDSEAARRVRLLLDEA